MNGTVVAVTPCNGSCQLLSCPDDSFEVEVEYRSTNPRYPGTGTALACVVDNGEGANAPADKAIIKVKDGPQGGPYELPAARGLPLSRLSTADVAEEARRCGLVATISDTTVWRWLHEDAIRPWQHRCWIFPRDPHFAEKAGRILDLYGPVKK